MKRMVLCAATFTLACTSGGGNGGGSGGSSAQSGGDSGSGAGGDVTGSGGGIDTPTGGATDAGGQAGATVNQGGTGGGNAGGSAGRNAGGAGGSGGAAGRGGASPACGGGSAGSGVATGTPGVWEPMLRYPTGTQPISGDALVGDPARPSDFYFFYEEYQPNGQPRHVLKSTDFGKTWVRVDQTPVVGNPWGVAIDPNPCRAAGVPPTMYTPAGYGDGGVWKSTDGGVTWANLFANSKNGVVPKTGGGTTTFPPDKNGYPYDFYQIHILPDTPPNHILVTYHYQAAGQPAPLGESKDGGLSWEVHLLPGGDSHYAFAIDASTWIVISGEGSNGGTYRTTSAGRIDGKISRDAWTKVDNMEHTHGAFTPFHDRTNGYLYFAAGNSGIRRSMDGGATWKPVYSGGSRSTLVASATKIYAQGLGNPALSTASLATPTQWTMAPVPSDPAWSGGVPPFGAASSFDGTRWVILKAEYGKCSNNCQPARAPLLANGEIWRYIEP